MIIGIFLVVIGAVWLLSNLDVITASVSQVIWPLIVIALGLAIFLKKKKGHHFGCCCCGPEEKEKEKKEEV